MKKVKKKLLQMEFFLRMMAKMLKKKIKEHPEWLFFLKPLVRVAKWRCSPFPLLRYTGNIFSFVPYCILRNQYYFLLEFMNSHQHQGRKKKQPRTYLPETFFIKVITGIQKPSVDEFHQICTKLNLGSTVLFSWGERFMRCGRLDLAKVAFIKLTQEMPGDITCYLRLRALRYAGLTCFLRGESSEANHLFKLTGQFKKTLRTPRVPENYKILGPCWRAAFGHLALLDYYIKYIQLYSKDKKTLRIVAPWNAQEIPGQELMNKYHQLGITVIEPQALENDYDKWADPKGYLSWRELSLIERDVMVHDFFEYEFPEGKILSYPQAFARIHREWEFAQNSPLFTLNQEEKDWVENYLAYLGKPKDAWYVCLHVREAGFHQKWNSHYPSLRDANIDDYFLAIEQIVKAGGWVVRMGDSSMKPLPSMPQVIDYAHSQIKTPKADILISAACKFLLGTNSGYANMCAIYNIPCALTNWVPLGWPLWASQDLIIPKLFREKNLRRYLTLEEIFKRDLAFIQNCSDVPSEMELIANTPEDIADLAMEMLHQCASNVVEAPLPAQLRYQEIAERYESYAAGRLGKTFVKKHPKVFLEDENERHIEELKLVVSNVE